MSDTDLLFTPAAKAAALIRDRKLSPVEYVDVVLKAIDHAQPKLNCFREVMADEARRDARKAEEAVARGDALGPLHGVPVSIKDLVDVKGVHTRHGSAIFEDNVAQADDVLVQRLRAAGAIIVGKATTPEFGVKGLTDGPSFGITRNPWNLERTPGGSSGGGASAVAAGLGITLMPRALIGPAWRGARIRAHRLKPVESRVQTVFVRRRDVQPSSALLAFQSHVTRGHVTKDHATKSQPAREKRP